MLGANKVEKIEQLAVLKNFRQLLQLDLLNNPIVNLPGYRAQVFSMFPSMSILDTLDKVGKDAYNNSTMMEAVSRIPDSLFDKSPPPPPVPLALAPVHHKEKKKLTHALARTGSLDSITHRSKPVAVTKKDRSKGGKSKIAAIAGGKSKASRAGLLFPVGRMKRKLKEIMIGSRVGVGSAIYMAAVLEYLTAELVEIAGNSAKGEGKKRITPLAIKNALKGDE
jgi:histone H2A